VGVFFLLTTWRSAGGIDCNQQIPCDFLLSSCLLLAVTLIVSLPWLPTRSYCWCRGVVPAAWSDAALVLRYPAEAGLGGHLGSAGLAVACHRRPLAGGDLAPVIHIAGLLDIPLYTSPILPLAVSLALICLLRTGFWGDNRHPAYCPSSLTGPQNA